MTGLSGLIEITEVPAGTPGAVQSKIDGAWRTFEPVTAIITPAYPVAAKERYLLCGNCGEIKPMKYEGGYCNVYRCECGEAIEYIVVTRSGKL